MTIWVFFFFFFFCAEVYLSFMPSSQPRRAHKSRTWVTWETRKHKAQGCQESRQPLKKKKISFNTSLGVIHCPRLQSQSHTHNAQNKPESWKLANLGYNLQVWIFAVLNLLSTLSRLRLKCNSYKIFIYSLLLNMLCLFLNLFFWFSLSF